MAEDGVAVENTMRDLCGIREISPDRTDTTMPGSLEDSQLLRERDPDAIEDRFRVDRKKLEGMLQAAAEGKGQSGEDFFQKVSK
ncbi:protein bicaudal C homolog 1-A-like [Saccoglossus kowalevskii]